MKKVTRAHRHRIPTELKSYFERTNEVSATLATAGEVGGLRLDYPLARKGSAKGKRSLKRAGVYVTGPTLGESRGASLVCCLSKSGRESLGYSPTWFAICEPTPFSRKSARFPVLISRGAGLPDELGRRFGGPLESVRVSILDIDFTFY